LLLTFSQSLKRETELEDKIAKIGEEYEEVRKFMFSPHSGSFSMLLMQDVVSRKFIFCSLFDQIYSYNFGRSWEKIKSYSEKRSLMRRCEKMLASNKMQVSNKPSSPNERPFLEMDNSQFPQPTTEQLSK